MLAFSVGPVGMEPKVCTMLGPRSSWLDQFLITDGWEKSTRTSPPIIQSQFSVSPLQSFPV